MQYNPSLVSQLDPYLGATENTPAVPQSVVSKHILWLFGFFLECKVLFSQELKVEIRKTLA